MRPDSIGPQGEQAVADWLASRGYELLARNARVGRYELDIVARRGAMLVFCEVKSAAASAAIAPTERLRPAQQQRVRRAAAGWLRAHPLRGIEETRLDAAFVRVEDDGEAQVTYYEGAF